MGHRAYGELDKKYPLGLAAFESPHGVNVSDKSYDSHFSVSCQNCVKTHGKRR